MFTDAAGVLEKALIQYAQHEAVCPVESEFCTKCLQLADDLRRQWMAYETTLPPSIEGGSPRSVIEGTLDALLSNLTEDPDPNSTQESLHALAGLFGYRVLIEHGPQPDCRETGQHALAECPSDTELGSVTIERIKRLGEG